VRGIGVFLLVLSVMLGADEPSADLPDEARLARPQDIILGCPNQISFAEPRHGNSILLELLDCARLPGEPNELVAVADNDWIGFFLEGEELFQTFFSLDADKDAFAGDKRRHTGQPVVLCLRFVCEHFLEMLVTFK